MRDLILVILATLLSALLFMFSWNHISNLIPNLPANLIELTFMQSFSILWVIRSVGSVIRYVPQQLPKTKKAKE